MDLLLYMYGNILFNLNTDINARYARYLLKFCVRSIKKVQPGQNYRFLITSEN